MIRTQRIPEGDLKLYHVFGDETCQTKHEWMGLGTTGVADEHLDHVRAMFRAWRATMGLHGEIKWEYTDKKNVERYKTMVTVYFNLLKRGIIQFHVMMIPMAEFDHRAYGNDVPESAYNRLFHYLLLRKYCGPSLAARKYFVLFDDRTSIVPWGPFQDAVNRAAARDYRMDHWPFRRVRDQKSHLDIMLEVNDLVLGAFGFWWNKKHRVEPTSSSPKGALARHVKNAAGRNSLFENPKGPNFTIWKMDFKKRP